MLKEIFGQDKMRFSSSWRTFSCLADVYVTISAFFLFFWLCSLSFYLNTFGKEGFVPFLTLLLRCGAREPLFNYKTHKDPKKAYTLNKLMTLRIHIVIHNMQNKIYEPSSSEIWKYIYSLYICVLSNLW